MTSTDKPDVRSTRMRTDVISFTIARHRRRRKSIWGAATVATAVRAPGGEGEGGEKGAGEGLEGGGKRCYPT